MEPTSTRDQQIQQQFAAEIAQRYAAIEPALKQSLKHLRSDLHIWAGDDAQAHAVVNAILKKVDAAFGAHWPDTADKYNTVLPELRPETAIATMVDAYNPLMGFKRMMTNPQLLAQAFIIKTTQQLHEASGLPPMIAGDFSIMEAVRDACKPLMRMPQYDDHQMHL